MYISLYLPFIVLNICFLALFRNYLVFNIRNQAIDFIHNFNIKMINEHQKYESITLDILEKPSYYKMMFMITCWSYNSFYNDLRQRCEEIYNENL